MKFYPYEKGGGAKNVLPILKGGGGETTCFGVVSTRVLPSFNHTGGGAQNVSSLEKCALGRGGGGRKMFYPVLRGCSKSFGPAISSFCSTSPLPIINDQSLIGDYHVETTC